MAAEIWPITDSFVAEVGDVDLAMPLEPDDWNTIHDAFNHYAVLVFPGQSLQADQHVAFANRFGPIDSAFVSQMKDRVVRTPPEIADVSNLDGAGNLLTKDDRLLYFQRGNRLWHTDSSFKSTPARASLLYMRSIPPVGGHTEFADMRAAWDALDEPRRTAIEGRIALHSIATSRMRIGIEMSAAEVADYPQVPQAMVRTHRFSGRRSIYVASHAGQVIGMEDTEARSLIDGLVDHATQRQFVYTHRWRVGDLVMWDNTCLMHRGREFDDTRWPRDAQRATSLDVANTCVQEGLEVPVGALSSAGST